MICVFAGGIPLTAGVMLLVVFSLQEFYRLSTHNTPVSQFSTNQWGTFIFGALFIIFSLGSALLLRATVRGDWWLLLGVASTALCDVGAYLTGKLFGRHKLAPQVSPAKTVEGTVGGVILSLISTFSIGAILHIPWGHRVTLGALLAIAAVVGDLLESYIKRKTGVKDSGTLLAGHGGVLDRLDSHLLALPTLFLYKSFFI